MIIPFNKPCLAGNEEVYVTKALQSLAHCGNRAFGERCCAVLKERYGFHHVFLTPSCTAGLEMGALLAGLESGDEVILPSYTFSSTANAVVLRGARPIFCEVESSTMNIDVGRIAELMTGRTRMIAPIDYAGIPCPIDAIMDIAKPRGLFVMLDAAQSLHATVEGRPVGSTADVSVFSFHETKNFSCGEGGALVFNDPSLVERATFIQEKGTDRSLVLQGVKSKYWWVEKGSSFLLSNFQAAVLLAQLEAAERIVALRAKITDRYRELFLPYEQAGCLAMPHPPTGVQINHHAFFVLFDTMAHRAVFLDLLREKRIYAYIGYMPLHSSPMGQHFGYRPEDLPRTEDLASRIVRLPFYTALAEEGLDYCVAGMEAVLHELYGRC